MEAVPGGAGHTVHCTRPMICCSSCPELGPSASPRSSPTRWRPEAVRSRRRTGWLPTAAGLYGRTSLERACGPSPPPTAVPSGGRAACGSATWRVSAGRRGTCLDLRFRPRTMSCGRKAARRTLRASREIAIFSNDLRWGGKALGVPLERPWRVAMRPATGWLGRGSHLQRCAGRSPRVQKPRVNGLLTR